MIYKGLNRIGMIGDIKTKGGGEIAEVYGGINESNPIYYKSRTITGTPPLNYKALGKPLSDYLISGNTIQDGTPTPSDPVDVIGCGEKTENLFDGFDYYGIVPSINNGNNADYAAGASTGYIKVDNPLLTLSKDESFGNARIYIFLYDDNKAFIGYALSDSTKLISWNISNYTSAKFARIRVDSYHKYAEQYMLNTGSTALPYEPYGYKIPPTVNGAKYPIYLGQVPTTRRVKKLVLTGEEPGWTVITSDNQALLSLPATAVSRTVFSTHYKGLVQAVAGNAWINSSLDKLIIMDTVHATDATTFKQWLAAQYANGTPVTVWYVLTEPTTSIVNEPLHKIGDYADTISMAQAGVTIQTIAGANTLTIDTTVQPSEISITGNIKEVST